MNEKKKGGRKDKQMAMVMQMQMAIISAIMGIPSTSNIDKMFSLMQQLNNMNTDTQFQDI
jgi:cation transport regulator ChaC